MAKKFDGVIEAVRYNDKWQITLVRAYELIRGVTYSDCLLLDRDALLKRLKAGKKFTIGQRKKYLASEFVFGKTVRVISTSSKDFITTLDVIPDFINARGIITMRDEIEDTPAF